MHYTLFYNPACITHIKKKTCMHYTQFIFACIICIFFYLACITHNLWSCEHLQTFFFLVLHALNTVVDFYLVYITHKFYNACIKHNFCFCLQYTQFLILLTLHTIFYLSFITQFFILHDLCLFYSIHLSLCL